MCYGTITPFVVLLEGSHDTTLVLQPSLRQIPSKGFLAGTSLSFCYQICTWKGFVASRWPCFTFAVSRTSKFPEGTKGSAMVIMISWGMSSFSPNTFSLQTAKLVPLLLHAEQPFPSQVGLVPKASCHKVKKTPPEIKSVLERISNVFT